MNSESVARRALLQVRSLCKSYQSGPVRLQVLSDLSIDIGEGAMVAVTGESGSGKSTFLHLVGGMEKPDSGEIRLNGVDLAALPSHELAGIRNRRIGFVFQFHHLLPEFTALENVMFPLLLRRESFGAAERQARPLLAEVGLEARLQHKPGELSGGEQQRVAIARALVGEPQLLLADEPTGNLDERTSTSIFDLLRAVQARRQLTCLIVTHNLWLASRCDAAKHMKEGKLI